MMTTFFFCEKKNFVSTKKSIMCIQKRNRMFYIQKKEKFNFWGIQTPFCKRGLL